jgi:hypothetical protein
MLQMGVHTHLITCRAAIPLILRTAGADGTLGLVVEVTDGTSEANAEFRRNVGFYYDLVKANVADREGARSRAGERSGGGRRGDSRLAALRADAGELRRLRGELAGRMPGPSGFAISESPTYVARRQPARLLGLHRRLRVGAGKGPRHRRVPVGQERPLIAWYLRCATPGASTARTCSSCTSAAPRLPKTRAPSPSNTGTTWSSSSSSSPAARYC